eukprot:985589-Pyramimonas_sp.AAC.1
MGRWRNDVLTATDDIIFWIVHDKAHMARRPLSHVMNFLSSRPDHEGQGTRLYLLVVGKGLEFQGEFENLLRNEVYMGVDNVPLPFIDPIRRITVTLALHHASAFHRRFLRGFEEFPLKLFHLIRAHPEDKCVHRQRVAAEILGTSEDNLEGNALKIRRQCPGDLELAKHDGRTGPKLYIIISHLMMHLDDNTEEIEGYNSLLKFMGKRAPSMSIDLLSSRANLKKRLGVGTSATAGELPSEIMQNADGLHRALLPCAHHADIMFNNVFDRWRSPPIAGLPTDAE